METTVLEYSDVEYSENAFDDMPVTEAKEKATAIRQEIFNLFSTSEKSYYHAGQRLVMLEESGLARAAMVELHERSGVTLEQGYSLWYDDESAALELPADKKTKAKDTYRVGHILFDADLVSAPEKVSQGIASALAPILNRTEEKNGKIVRVGSPARVVEAFKNAIKTAKAEQKKVTNTTIMVERRKMGLADPVNSKTSYVTVGGIEKQIVNLTDGLPKVRQEDLANVDLALIAPLLSGLAMFRDEVERAKKVRQQEDAKKATGLTASVKKTKATAKVA